LNQYKNASLDAGFRNKNGKILNLEISADILIRRLS
jgi:hypothetical protein